MTKLFDQKVKLLVFVLFCLVTISLLLFFFSKREIDNKEPFIVKFKTSDIITLKNTLPVSDKLGKSYNGEDSSLGIYGYVEFSIENRTEDVQNYEIYLIKQVNDNNEIKDSFIKTYLTDLNEKPYGAFKKDPIILKDLSLTKGLDNGVTLLKEKINGYEKKQFKLRVWVSDAYAFTNNEATFSFDVDVR